MKLSRLSSVAGLAFTMIIALPSCVTYDNGGGNYSSVNRPPARAMTATTFGAAQPREYRDGRGFDSFQRRPDPFYNSGFGSNRHHDHHYGHRHDHRDHDDHNDHRKSTSSSSNNRKHHPNSYQIVGGSTGSKVKPKGFHSVSWYKSKGYDVSKLKLKNEDGEYYRKKKR